ncbi:MAG: DUF1848 domain-containing protein [Candidatus Spyradenecus sp.]
MATARGNWEKGEIVLPDGRTVEAAMPVIISASRATDLPAFYAERFMADLRSGWTQWKNPFNGVTSFIGFAKTRLIVFWSKNPAPLLPHLDELDRRGLNTLFQFTLNDYQTERLEPNVPALDDRIATFRSLSERVGRSRVFWRFDPLVLTDTLPLDALLERIERLGDRLAPYTERLIFSFIDIHAYRSVASNLAKAGIAAREFTQEEIIRAAQRLGELARNWGITVATCGEAFDLTRYGIEHSHCLDARHLVRTFSHDHALMNFLGARHIPGDLFGGEAHWEAPEKPRKDKGQRTTCGCVPSKDIGEYNTCPHLCRYCYANADAASAVRNWRARQSADADVCRVP